MDEGQGFRRALKNPVVVVSLCVIAGFAGYFNMMNDTSDVPGMFSQGLNQFLSPSSPASLTHSQTTHDVKAVQWIDHPDRDPFAPISFASHSGTNSSLATEPQQVMKPPSIHHGLTLKAVAVEGQQRSAVINRTVVYEGEMVEGYQVTSIQPNGVWLIYQGKTQWLTFEEKTDS